MDEPIIAKETTPIEQTTEQVAPIAEPATTPIVTPAEFPQAPPLPEITTPSSPVVPPTVKPKDRKIALVYSVKDPAGMLIAQKIEELGKPDWAVFYEIEQDIVFANLNKIKEQEIIFLSKHQSEAGTKSLTVHMIGNYGEAKFGGKGREICGALSRIGGNYLRALNEKNISSGLNKSGFLVTMEVTHHGPYTMKDCLFVEVGSSPVDWKNELAAQVVAETVINETLKENKDTVVIGLGGGHYAPDFTKLVLRKNYSFGHICPKHQLENLNKDLLQKMIDRSKATEIILDWKGLKENKDRVLFLCSKLNLPSHRVQTLLKEVSE